MTATTPHAAAVRAARKHFDPAGSYEKARASDFPWLHNQSVGLAKLIHAEYAALVETAERAADRMASFYVGEEYEQLRAELARVKGGI